MLPILVLLPVLLVLVVWIHKYVYPIIRWEGPEVRPNRIEEPVGLMVEVDGIREGWESVMALSVLSYESNNAVVHLHVYLVVETARPFSWVAKGAREPERPLISRYLRNHCSE